jgi:hypothetical protein
MELVLKAKPGAELEITGQLANALKAPNHSVVSAVRTIKPAYKSLALSVKAPGMVTYDVRRIYTVPARTGGRIEKMHIKYEFQHLRKGQKIADIYSPELITAQRELLYLLENDAQNNTLLEGAKSKLELLGFSATQVKDLIDRKSAINTFSIYSPYDGYVIASDIAPSPSKEGLAEGDMTASSATSQRNSPAFPIPDGTYVTAGQTLARIVNTNSVRVELYIDQQQTGSVQAGDKIEVDFGNGTKEQATVDVVEPFFDKGQTFLKLRLYAKKIETLPIGQLVQATFQFKSAESLWVSKTAVVDLGNDKVVFIKDREAFKPKRIVSGIMTPEFVEVTSGLSSSDEIASNAQYLIDSESFIKPAN